MTEDELHNLKESVKTTRALCDIALLLIDQKQESLTPTILELMLVECQAIVDNYCVVRG